MSAPRANVPLSFFGIAVGLLAMANAWRVAERIWHASPAVVDAVSIVALAVWAGLVGILALRAWRDRTGLRTELEHPVHSAFAALVGVSSLLASQVLRPLAPTVALGVLFAALTVTVIVGVGLHGRLWQGAREAATATPALYLPAVGQNLVAGASLAAFGWPTAGMLFFGAGLLSWLAIESVLLQRAATSDPLPPALRPTLGIQLAPPVVAGVAYLALTTGVPDLFTQALFGYGLFQALLMARLVPWIRAQGFVPGYWAFSFGVAALPTLAMRMLERGGAGPAAVLALPLFVVANGIIGWLAARTLVAWLGGRLLPQSAAAPVASAAR